MTAQFRTVMASFLAILLATGPVVAAEEVNIYSYRKEGLIKPLLDKFSEATGITVNLVTGKADALLERLQSEAQNSPADMLITVDAGRLHRAKAAGVLQAVESDVLQQAIPKHLRDQDNTWFGLSQRSRIIVYNKDSIDPAQLSTYEDLADPKWKGQICIRSSGNIYNQSLLASMIEAHSEADAEAWAKGMVANFARDPKGNDRAQIKAVAAGECNLAVTNHYYIAKMLTASEDDDQKEAAEKTAIHFPNQSGRGAHMNVSGAGITKHAPNRDNAIKLLEYLISEEAQQWYAEANHEYPVRDGVAVSELVESFGYPFKQDNLNLTLLGTHNATAVKVFDRAGWK